MKAAPRFLARSVLFALLVFPSHQVMAQTNINYYAQFGPTNTVRYLPFNVSVGGTFILQTSGLKPIDPWILLFSGLSSDGSGMGSWLGGSDDNAPNQPGFRTCGGAGGTCHSWFSIPLGAGNYTLAMSVAGFTEADARAGVNSFNEYQFAYGNQYCHTDGDWSDCGYDVSVTSGNGTAEVVPEPATMSLLATGLVGLAGLRRRRNKA